MIVTHSNFDDEFKKAEDGIVNLYIPTAYRCYVINQKTIHKFKNRNLTVLKKDKDNKGFRMMSGKSSVYIFEGQLLSRSI